MSFNREGGSLSRPIGMDRRHPPLAQGIGTGHPATQLPPAHRTRGQ